MDVIEIFNKYKGFIVRSTTANPKRYAFLLDGISAEHQKTLELFKLTDETPCFLGCSKYGTLVLTNRGAYCHYEYGKIENYLWKDVEDVLITQDYVIFRKKIDSYYTGVFTFSRKSLSDGSLWNNILKEIISAGQSIDKSTAISRGQNSRSKVKSKNATNFNKIIDELRKQAYEKEAQREVLGYKSSERDIKSITIISSQEKRNPETGTSSSKKERRTTKEEVEGRYQELLALLQQTRDEIGTYSSKHKNISKLQSDMHSALDLEMKNVAQEIDNAMNLISWDNLVIAFFGETNAGKSTIIETFRILFERNRKQGQDGLIVGDGQQDFTKDYHEYKMSIGGKPFTLIDVPGIEGNEAEFQDVIKEALHKAHCVFYVQGHNKKPDSATAEKIKNYLGDWVNVYSIQNVRGSITNYDEEEERETLLTPNVLKNEQLIKESFHGILGGVYKGNITLQALLAMCAKASFSDKREDLQRNQTKLLNYFGDAEEVLRFSQFHTIKQLVEEKASSFTDEIAEANKQKMISLARRSALSLEKVLSNSVDTSDIEQKLYEFKRDVLQIISSAQTNIEHKVPGIVRTKLSILKNDLYGFVGQGFDKLKTNGHRRVNATCNEINTEIKNAIRNEIDNASRKIDNKKKDLPSVRLKSGFNAHININVNVDLSEALEELDLNLDKIGNFALKTAGMAATGFMIGGPIGAGIGAAIGAVASWRSGDGGKAEAKKYIAESISEAEEKNLSQIRIQINAVKRELNDEQRKLTREIDNEIDNLSALSDSNSSLKNDIRKFINKLNNTTYGAV